MSEPVKDQARRLMERLVPYEEWVASLDAERRRQVDMLGGPEAVYARTRMALEELSA